MRREHSAGKIRFGVLACVSTVFVVITYLNLSVTAPTVQDHVHIEHDNALRSDPVSDVVVPPSPPSYAVPSDETYYFHMSQYPSVETVEDDGEPLSSIVARMSKKKPLVTLEMAGLSDKVDELHVSEHFNNSNVPLLLYYYPVSRFFGEHMLKPAEPCPALCSFTEQLQDLDRAAAAILHVPVYRYVNPPQDVLRRGLITVALSMESVSNYPTLIKLGKSCDLEMSYRLKADVWTPFFGPRIPFRQEPLEKTEDAIGAAFISNCASMNDRESVLDELISLVGIDSFGVCSHNTGDRDRSDKMKILERYKFYLAFENSSEDDYVTEKIYHALRVGSVPVYMGADNVDVFVPSPNSVIKLTDFESVRDLAKYLVYLDQNPEEYNRWLQWKTEPFSPAFEYLRNITTLDARCRLCMRVHSMLQKRT